VEQKLKNQKQNTKKQLPKVIASIVSSAIIFIANITYIIFHTIFRILSSLVK